MGGKNPRYVGVEIRVDCESCWQSQPINGPMRGRIHCPFCGEPKLLKDHVEGAIGMGREYYGDLEAGEQVRAVSAYADHYYRFIYSRQRPLCRSCGAKLDLRQVEVGVASTLTCPCGTEWETVPAPTWIQAAVEDAAQLYGAESPHVPPADLPRADCPGCGAPLELGPETRRITRCEHCDAEVLVPEPAWLALHPVPVPRRWFVRLG